MAWVTDPNFGSALFAVENIPLFDTPPTNKSIAGAGIGASYRDDIDIADIEISCSIAWHRIGSSDATPGIHLIGRRQTSGDFYSASILARAFSGGSREVTISHYNATTDTFTALAIATVAASHIFAWQNASFPPDPDLLTFRFRIQGNVLETSVFNETKGGLVVSAGTIDNTITASGNPGFGSHITQVNIIRAVHFMDDLQFNSI